MRDYSPIRAVGQLAARGHTSESMPNRLAFFVADMNMSHRLHGSGLGPCDKEICAGVWSPISMSQLTLLTVTTDIVPFPLKGDACAHPYLPWLNLLVGHGLSPELCVLG